ncbi:hypothetical protein TNCV_1377381 [Trichonephila clavipes]|nr:hypothetical protein TNCV_1377381 [Trichonephila clavipes]
MHLTKLKPPFPAILFMMQGDEEHHWLKFRVILLAKPETDEIGNVIEEVLDLARNSLRGYDEEESNDEEYKSKYDSSTEIDPDLEEGDSVENRGRDTQRHLGRT